MVLSTWDRIKAKDYRNVTCEKLNIQNIEEDEQQDIMANLLLYQCEKEILYMITDTDNDKYFSVVLDMMLITHENPYIANYLLEDPQKALLTLERALYESQIALISKINTGTAKPNALVRLGSQPPIIGPKGNYRTRIRDVRVEDVNKLLRVVGTVMFTSRILLVEVSKTYRCSSCSFQFQVNSGLEDHSLFIMPTICPSSRLTKKRGCRSTTFKYVEGSKHCRNIQEIIIMERLNGAQNIVAQCLICTLQDDLVERVKVGDDVVINGIVQYKWLPIRNKQRCTITQMLNATSIFVINDTKFLTYISLDRRIQLYNIQKKYHLTPYKLRNILINSLCPTLIGFTFAKLCIWCLLLSGVNTTNKNTTNNRNDIHTLFIGDPGTGKSQLMRYITAIYPRSVLTSGNTSTNAGLTVSASIDSTTGEWGLHAGALVLADQGICCIDEFNCMSSSDHSTIHEAMEQQTISVAKAGIVTTLQTRVSIFAALNPRNMSTTATTTTDTIVDDTILSYRTKIKTPLLSRFDLIVLSLDNNNRKYDTDIARKVLNQLPKPTNDSILQSKDTNSISKIYNSSRILTSIELDTINKEKVNKYFKTTSSSSSSSILPIEMISTYIQYARSNFDPILTPQSQQVLERYYNLRRKQSRDCAIQALNTVRLLESSIRIAQAHAKLLFHEYVTVQDAIQAILILDTCYNSVLHWQNPTWDPTYNDTSDIEDTILKEEKEIINMIGLDNNIQNETYKYTKLFEEWQLESTTKYDNHSLLYLPVSNIDINKKEEDISIDNAIKTKEISTINNKNISNEEFSSTVHHVSDQDKARARTNRGYLRVKRMKEIPCNAQNLNR